MYSRVFIVVDALDECRVAPLCQKTFLSELFNLQAKCGANILATSRFIPEITGKFQGSILLEVRASEHDVRRYVDGFVSSLTSFVGCSPNLQEKLKTTLPLSSSNLTVASTPKYAAKCSPVISVGLFWL